MSLQTECSNFFASKKLITRFLEGSHNQLLDAALAVKFRMKYGFQPPIRGSDLVGYEIILDFIRQCQLSDVEGDVVEIGSFLGGGTYKLAKFFEKNGSQKKIFAVDIFDPNFDVTENSDGKAMSTLYSELLKKFRGRSQWEIFSEVIKECKNIHCLKGDSKEIDIPSSRLCLGFIDGNHNPEYVENDFYLIWNKLASRGAVGFHDYEWDLPQTTAKIKDLVNRHGSEIRKVHLNKDAHALFVLKR